MDRNIIVRNERVDDLPVLLARQREVGIATLINQYFMPHGNWQGARPGEIVVAWLTFILSEGDHRLNGVAEWFRQRSQTIGHYVEPGMTMNDFRDDRLAIILRELSDDARWSAFEGALNQQTIRVYDLRVERIRLDATTVSGHWQVTEDGLFQYGHSKDHRPDLPQLKVMLTTLDPLGMPLATSVVSGNRADDPLYVPAIRAVRQSLQKSGLLYIGDVKMAALQTRLFVQQQKDYYLCPLSEVQLPRAELLNLIAPALHTPSLLTSVMRRQADGESILIADAFEREVEQGGEVDGKRVTWTERQILARSHKYAHSQTKALYQRLYRAQSEIATLNERKQGKPHRQTRPELACAVEQILQCRQAAGLLAVEYTMVVDQRRIRKYGDRPERLHHTEQIVVSATLNEPALAALVPTLGWRVYVTNAPPARLPLPDALLAYREQYTEERAFGRLKGKPLALTPMFLEKDDHATGLVRLLSLGLRILSLLEYSARSLLQQAQQPIAGLYAGNPTRSTLSPTAERLLAAFKGITLTIIQQADAVAYFLTPLSDTHSRVLKLLGFDDSLYLSLVEHLSWKPPSLLHEP